MSQTKPDCDSIVEEKPTSHLSYNEIASKLLNDKLLLTALELHTELLEAGKELRVLRDFFSNPGNFETFTQEPLSRLSRSGSQATLDSLDLARYSEDGAVGDERVAVLEFELRKAKETINALRTNLTVAIESETSTPDKGSLRNISFSTIKPHEQRALNFLINEYLLIQGYKLTSITFADENQNQDFDDWDDVGLNISKPPELVHLYREGLRQSGQSGVTVATQTDSDEDSEKEDLIRDQGCELEKLKSKVYFLEADLAELQSIKESQVKLSESPERFEVVKKADYDDSISNNSFNINEWAKIDYQKTGAALGKEFDELSVESFAKEIFTLCYVSIDQNFDVLNGNLELDDVIYIVSDSLLKIIPNIILNKRDEVIPLLMIAIYLNPKVSERDKLLQQLFHIKKKPTDSERMTILAAVVGIAKRTGEQMVENEILPQCWLQLTHKNVERRQLVAEACTVLIPYVSSPIRNSLILSMLQQMLEDKEEIVREQVIKALALLFCHCQDDDKYIQCEQLALNSLRDSSNSVFNLSHQILFPVLARWALQAGYLVCSLFKKLLQKLNEHVKNVEAQSRVNQEVDQINRILLVIDNLLPFLLVFVANQEIIISNIEKDVIMPMRSDFGKLSCTTNPEHFLTSDLAVGTILYDFDRYIADNPNASWTEMDWVVDVMLPDLLNNLHHIELAQHSILEGFLNLFAHICTIFDQNFTKYKVRPILHKYIQNLEQVISSFNQYCPTLNVIPIYVSVLRYTKDYDEITSVIKKFLSALPLCGSPLDCLEVTVRKLCEAGLQDVVVDCLWSGVVHQRPLVKSASATLFCSIIGSCGEELLKSKIAGAIVTLANDSDILVRTATIPALGRLITNCNVKEIHDKAYMQLQQFVNDPTLKENHTLSRQLIVTLGNIFAGSSNNFKNDVIVPQLTNFAIFMSQMTNHTRKIDLALALIEAFTHVVYNPVYVKNMGTVVKPGLKCLETVIADNSSLSMHHETVLSMIRECENKSIQNSPTVEVKFGQNVNQGVEDMRQRMSKMFHKPQMSKSNTLPNLPGLFKKK